MASSILQDGPVRKFLRERPRLLTRQPGYQALPLPGDVSAEQAVAVLERTPWARNAAEGVASGMGLTGPEREKAVDAWAHHLAEGMVGSMLRAQPRAPASEEEGARVPQPTQAVTSGTRKRRSRQRLSQLLNSV